MCRVGECECFNTEEGADFAIGNIWEMYVAQTNEGITNLIKYCSCEVQDVMLNVRESSNDISVYLNGVFVTGSTIIKRDMLFSVLRKFSGTDCLVSRGSSRNSALAFNTMLNRLRGQ